jgi:hypothetical protein
LKASSRNHDPYPGQILGPQGPILITEGFDGKEDRQEWELLEILDFQKTSGFNIKQISWAIGTNRTRSDFKRLGDKILEFHHLRHEKHPPPDYFSKYELRTWCQGATHLGFTTPFLFLFFSLQVCGEIFVQ